MTKQSTLDSVLLPVHLAAGIILIEEDNHILKLVHGKEVIAQYSTTGILISKIRKDADLWLIKK